MNYVRFLFDCNLCIEDKTFQIGCQNDRRICPGIPLNPTTSNMFVAGHRQTISAALCIIWQKNITNKEMYIKSSLLPFSPPIQSRLCLICHSLRLQNRSITPPGTMLQHLNIAFSVWRGQGRTWTLAKDFLNDLNTIDCNINNVINFSSSQFARLVDSSKSYFYC